MENNLIEIGIMVRCSGCKKWFTCKKASAKTKCPLCGCDIDEMATTRILDLAVEESENFDDELDGDKMEFEEEMAQAYEEEDEAKM